MTPQPSTGDTDLAVGSNATITCRASSGIRFARCLTRPACLPLDLPFRLAGTSRYSPSRKRATTSGPRSAFLLRPASTHRPQPRRQHPLAGRPGRLGAPRAAARLRLWRTVPPVAPQDETRPLARGSARRGGVLLVRVPHAPGTRLRFWRWAGEAHVSERSPSRSGRRGGLAPAALPIRAVPPRSRGPPAAGQAPPPPPVPS